MPANHEDQGGSAASAGHPVPTSRTVDVGDRPSGSNGTGTYAKRGHRSPVSEPAYRLSRCVDRDSVASAVFRDNGQGPAGHGDRIDVVDHSDGSRRTARQHDGDGRVAVGDQSPALPGDHHRGSLWELLDRCRWRDGGGGRARSARSAPARSAGARSLRARGPPRPAVARPRCTKRLRARRVQTRSRWIRRARPLSGGSANANNPVAEVIAARKNRSTHERGAPSTTWTPALERPTAPFTSTRTPTSGLDFEHPATQTRPGSMT